MKRCPYCAEEIQSEAIICRFCSRAVTAEGVAVTSHPAAPARTWSPGAAAVLSVVIPGLGQIYKGQIGLGLVLLVVTIVGYVFLILPGVIVHILTIVNAYHGEPPPAARHDRLPLGVPLPERIRTPEEIAADAERTRTSNRRAVGILGGLLLLWAALMAVAYLGPRAATTTRSGTPATSRQLSEEEEWNERLRAIVVGAGQRCSRATAAFHQGSRSGENYWSLRCSGGETFSVLLSGVGRKPLVRPCSGLNRRIACWQKFQ